MTCEESGARLTRRFLVGVGARDLRWDGRGPMLFLGGLALGGSGAETWLTSFSWPATRGIMLLRERGMRGPGLRVVEEAAELSVGWARGRLRPVARVCRRLFTMVFNWRSVMLNFRVIGREKGYVVVWRECCA